LYANFELVFQVVTTFPVLGFTATVAFRPIYFTLGLQLNWPIKLMSTLKACLALSWVLVFLLLIY